ncbi:MAG: hypoxanthine phosphoribosyltransferase [Dehalococcoidaceae bacterium]|nr:hypoxanthine phosphoribosyltransferase [Dehalococcoidaceae bacterium]
MEKSEQELISIFAPADIAEAVAGLAGRISSDYSASELLVLGILKGSFIFLADIVRMITVPLEIDFMRLSSYGSSTRTCGKVKMLMEPHTCVTGRHVLLVEDIVDSGLTTAYALDYIKKRNPLSLKMCALIDKHERRLKTIQIDYTGFSVEGGFLVGYGLDRDEKYRNLPGIYSIGGIKCL